MLLLSTMVHQPVLQKEVIKYLEVKPNENFVDATVGLAGHAIAILKKNKPQGKVLGIEADPEILKLTRSQISGSGFEDRLVLVNDSFVHLKEIIEKYHFKPIQGILFDLGMSSWHLAESARGFSFQKDEPLDMRYRPENSLTAKEIINSWSAKEIEEILREYGQERFARRIAREMVEAREKGPVKTTCQLVAIIKKATPPWYQQKRVHPATKTFQALRIAVNNELVNLEKVLPQALEVLEKNGRMAVISFHSLEDRIVKNFFRQHVQKGHLKILAKKPITPSKEEIEKNPRSRSAKLRTITKL